MMFFDLDFENCLFYAYLLFKLSTYKYAYLHTHAHARAHTHSDTLRHTNTHTSRHTLPSLPQNYRHIPFHLPPPIKLSSPCSSSLHLPHIERSFLGKTCIIQPEGE